MLQLRHFFFSLSLSHKMHSNTHLSCSSAYYWNTIDFFSGARGRTHTHTHTCSYTGKILSHNHPQNQYLHTMQIFFFHLVLYRSHFLFALTLTIEAWQTTAFFFTHTPLKNSRTHCDTSTLLKTLSLKQLKFHTRLKHSSTHKWNTLTHTS